MFDDITKSAALAALATLTAVFPAFAAPSGEVHAVGVYQGVRGAGFEEARLKLEEAYDRTLAELESSAAGDEAKGDALIASWEKHNADREKLYARFPAKVVVKVTRTGVPLTLVLTGYEATTWQVDPAPGVELEKIILAGFHKQELLSARKLRTGGRMRGKRGNRRQRANKRTAVVSAESAPQNEEQPGFFFCEDDSSTKYEMDYDPDTSEGVCSSRVDEYQVSTLLQAKREIVKLTGVEPTSMNGEYEGSEFEISAATTGLNMPEEDSIGKCRAGDAGKTMTQLLDERYALTDTAQDASEAPVEQGWWEFLPESNR